MSVASDDVFEVKFVPALSPKKDLCTSYFNLCTQRPRLLQKPIRFKGSCSLMPLGLRRYAPKYPDYPDYGYSGYRPGPYPPYRRPYNRGFHFHSERMVLLGRAWVGLRQFEFFLSAQVQGRGKEDEGTKLLFENCSRNFKSTAHLILEMSCGMIDRQTIIQKRNYSKTLAQTCSGVVGHAPS
ncbi:hypothetical protein J6590_080744 [Homalodisca vitripennis]|nr:hypothetical protein J6590_080744 [Homalodisca vitripennis]